MKKIHDILNYVNANSRNIGILIKIENLCGSHFQFLNPRERMALIRSISIQLCMEFSDSKYNLDLNELVPMAYRLSVSDRVGLIRCLADNISLPTMEKKNGN